MFIPMIWLKWRKKLDADTDAKIQAAYLELNDANKATINNATNKKIKTYCIITGVLLGLMLTLLVYGLIVMDAEAIASGAVLGAILMYGFVCDLTWVKAAPHEKMLLEVELAQKLLGAQEAEEQSQTDAAATETINSTNIAGNNVDTSADGSANIAENNVDTSAEAAGTTDANKDATADNTENN